MQGGEISSGAISEGEDITPATHAPHQLGYGQHLGAVVLVGLQCGDLRREHSLVLKASGSLHEGSASGLGSIHPGGLELRQSSEGLVIEPDRYSLIHVEEVSRPRRKMCGLARLTG